MTLFVDGRNLNNRHAIGDISAVVDYRNLLPFQQAIFYPVERRAVYGGGSRAFLSNGTGAGSLTLRRKIAKCGPARV